MICDLKDRILNTGSEVTQISPQLAPAIERLNVRIQKPKIESIMDCADSM